MTAMDKANEELRVAHGEVLRVGRRRFSSGCASALSYATGGSVADHLSGG